MPNSEEARKWKEKHRSERFCRIGGELLSNWDKARSKDAGLNHNICGAHAYKLAYMWISEHGYLGWFGLHLGTKGREGE